MADKTDTLPKSGSANDIALIWPAHCAPLVVAIYFTHDNKDDSMHPEVLAKATRIVIKEFARSNQCLKSTIASSKVG